MAPTRMGRTKPSDLTEPPPNRLHGHIRSGPMIADVMCWSVWHWFNVSMTFAHHGDAIQRIHGRFVGAPCWATSAARSIIFGQRVIEIWSSLPFLYTIIIISSIVVPIYVPGNAGISAFVLAARRHSRGIRLDRDHVYVRGEFYREKARDYVGAAIATGVSEAKIMFRHILPNALTPVVSFAPFVIVANISALRRPRLSRVRSARAHAKLG